MISIRKTETWLSIIVLICKEMRKVEGGNKRKLHERMLSVPNLSDKEENRECELEKERDESWRFSILVG
ncbi:hypothetical protein D5086_003808 [Populus alba]|uniref:Uncharacterized protein n=1 Tax=Populus alba TaxID=43335 RepID=A0ACC4D5D5_POPAL